MMRAVAGVTEDTDAATPSGASEALLWRIDLLDYGFEPALDRLSDLACNLLSAPHGLVSIIDDDGERQYFKSFSGLTGTLAIKRQTPLTQSLCRFVRDADDPLSITDAPTDARFCTHPAHVDLGIKAYLGQPIHLPSGAPIGSLCVFDDKPREWTNTDIDRLSALAGCVDDAISRMATLRDAEDAHRSAARAARARELFLTGLNHEIRTSLNSILGLTDALSDLTFDDEARDLLQIVGRSGNDLHVLLETLLDETATRSRDTGPDLRQKLHDIVVEVMDVLRFAHPAGMHSFAATGEGWQNELADADARRFKQVVYDLLGNAIIASPNGSTEIRVSPVGSTGLTTWVTLQADPQTGDTLHRTLPDLNFQLVQSLTTAVGGRFEITTQHPDCVVFEACLPLFSQDAQPET